MLKKIISLSALLLAFSHPDAYAQPTQSDGWQFTVGGGAVFSPNYVGDDSYQISVLPNLQVKYDDVFFASVQEGVGYHVIQTENWEIGPIAKLDFGREEDGEGPFQLTDGTNDLRGLGDIDPTVELGGYIAYKFRPVTAKLELRQAISGHEGFIGDFDLSYGGQAMIAGRPMIYSFGPSLTFADSKYHDSYFGVNARQSFASGLPQYSADDGILSYDFGGTLIVPVTEKIAAVLFANYGHLGSEAADSSLVERRGSENQFSSGLFLNYTF
jgi:outer membrane protein